MERSINLTGKEASDFIESIGAIIENCMNSDNTTDWFNNFIEEIKQSVNNYAKIQDEKKKNFDKNLKADIEKINKIEKITNDKRICNECKKSAPDRINTNSSSPKQPILTVSKIFRAARSSDECITGSVKFYDRSTNRIYIVRSISADHVEIMVIPNGMLKMDRLVQYTFTRNHSKTPITLIQLLEGRTLENYIVDPNNPITSKIPMHGTPNQNNCGSYFESFYTDIEFVIKGFEYIRNKKCNGNCLYFID